MLSRLDIIIDHLDNRDIVISVASIAQIWAYEAELKLFKECVFILFIWGSIKNEDDLYHLNVFFLSLMSLTAQVRFEYEYLLVRL